MSENSTSSEELLCVKLPLDRRVRFLVFGRSLPAIFFLGIGYLQFSNNLRPDYFGFRQSPNWVSGLDLVTAILYCLFSCIPVLMFLTATVPQRIDGRLVPRFAAFGGTTIQLVIGVIANRVPRLNGPQLLNTQAFIAFISALLVALSLGWGIYSLVYLRRNLSIIPQAKKLVDGGPYRIVRHPIYAAEIGAALGRIIRDTTVLDIFSVALLTSFQITRIVFEERLLKSTVALHYQQYANKVLWRLVPKVW